MIYAQKFFFYFVCIRNNAARKNGGNARNVGHGFCYLTSRARFCGAEGFPAGFELFGNYAYNSCIFRHDQSS